MDSLPRELLCTPCLLPFSFWGLKLLLYASIWEEVCRIDQEMQILPYQCRSLFPVGCLLALPQVLLLIAIKMLLKRCSISGNVGSVVSVLVV